MKDFPAVRTPEEDVPWIAYFYWEFDFEEHYSKDYVKIDEVEYEL